MSKLAKSGILSNFGKHDSKKSNKALSKENSVGNAQQSPTDTQTSKESLSADLPGIREKLRSEGISQAASNIILHSWRKNTRKSYSMYIKRWKLYACREDVHSTSPNLGEAINFLAHLFDCGLSYSAISIARSALSNFLEIKNCKKFGEHFRVKQFMKGVFELRPSLPKYQATWDVDIVLHYLESLQPVNTLSLKLLTLKLVMLLALITGQRCQTLSFLKLSEMEISDHKCIFYITSLLKQSRVGKHLLPIELLAFKENENLCIVHIIKEYLKRTEHLRLDEFLLISWRKPFKKVSKDTIARWIKEVMAKSGINTTIFKSHSTRSASTSAVAKRGAPIKCILDAAGWSRESTFAKFYKKETNQNFGRHLLQAYQNSIK